MTSNAPAQPTPAALALADAVRGFADERLLAGELRGATTVEAAGRYGQLAASAAVSVSVAVTLNVGC